MGWKFADESGAFGRKFCRLVAYVCNFMLIKVKMTT
jgi:hypothetical protein